jgi:hypothetical protein
VTSISTAFSFIRWKLTSVPAACDLAMATGACLWLMSPSQAMAQPTQEYFAGSEQAGQALVDAVPGGENAMAATIVGPQVIEPKKPMHKRSKCASTT